VADLPDGESTIVCNVFSLPYWSEASINRSLSTPITYYCVKTIIEVLILDIAGDKVQTWLAVTDRFCPEFRD
jgi:hypothetical protein